MPEQSLPDVPRASYVRFVPVGNYKIIFRFRNRSNLTLIEISAEYFYRGY
jgi:hypothetical protein